MPPYVAQLGHQPQLSLAELRAALPDIDDTRMMADPYAGFSTNVDITQDFLNRIGGTVMIARRITDSDLSLEDIPGVLVKELEEGSGKRTFSLRTLGFPRPQVKTLYRDCKDRLRKAGIASRYIGTERSPALPIQLHQLGLLDGKGGCELTILRDKKGLWVGRTVAAQDTEAYTKRDMGKPVRDMTVGILPPKLAQTMLVLAEFLARKRGRSAGDALTVFDPFCGSGVIPLEAMLRGWNVLCSDSSPKAVAGCQKNIEWLRKEFSIAKTAATSEVAKHDARKPFALATMPDVIVSETSLGPNLKARPGDSEAKTMRKDLEKLQEDFLKNAAKTLPGVPLVLTWPVWMAKKQQVAFERIGKTVEKLGYDFVLPPETPSMSQERPSLLYRRKDQFVAREIVLLVPRKK